MEENIAQSLYNRAQSHPDEPALMFKEEGKYVTKSVSWFWDRVEKIASGLLSLGIREMDKVAIMSGTRFRCSAPNCSNCFKVSTLS